MTPKENVLNMESSAICLPVKVKYSGHLEDPIKTDEIKAEFEIHITEGPIAGIWGNASTEEEAWIRAEERLLRFHLAQKAGEAQGSKSSSESSSEEKSA